MFVGHTMAKNAAPAQAAPSKVEGLKQESDGLEGQLVQEFADGKPNITENSYQLLKFHGSYQQDDRDVRRERKKQGLDRVWSFMVRTKFPGGRLSAEQYLVADELARYLRQQYPAHHYPPGFSVPRRRQDRAEGLIAALNERWMTTYGGCGDVARNTLTCPVADLLPGHGGFDFQALAQEISDHFLPESTAYYELWLDGEKVLADGTRGQGNSASAAKSFYGPTYMPRKHKMGIGLPDDNCIDMFTHDLALEAISAEDGSVQGFNLLAGGGLGSTHGKAETFPRLADRIGYLARR